MRWSDAPVIYVVTGYHEVTDVPELARDLGFRFRFAVVLSEEYLSLDILLAVVREVCGAVDYDALEVQWCGDAGPGASSVEEISERIRNDATWEGPERPPFRIYFRRNGQLVCLEETEFWGNAGGPWPYSDSDTLCLYTPTDMSARFQEAVTRACALAGGRMIGPIPGESAPIQTPWWRRLLIALDLANYRGEPHPERYHPEWYGGRQAQ